ncbi:MAG: oxidoreductase [Acidimicrobiales bacterium]
MTRRSGWTTSEVPDLVGRTIVVTGATSGIGLEAVRVFARRGATTILAARNELKASEAIGSVLSDHPSAILEFRHLDIAELASIHAFAEGLAADHSAIDVLVNNAGIMLVPFGHTDDGFERHFGTNHLGHFALTGLLLDRLDAAPAARVVTVSSIAHHDADISFDNLQYDGREGYTPMGAYRRSKLANLLFAFELQRRLTAVRSSTISVAVHPGVSDTNLGHHLSSRWWWRIARPVASALIQSSIEGALPTLRAATDPSVEGGQFYGPTGRRETTGPPELVSATALARDPDIATRLWIESADLTGVSYLE